MTTRIYLGKENDSVANAIASETGAHWTGVYWATGQDGKGPFYLFDGKMDKEMVRKIREAHPGIGEIEHIE